MKLIKGTLGEQFYVKILGELDNIQSVPLTSKELIISTESIRAG